MAEGSHRRGIALALAFLLGTTPAAVALAGTPAPDDGRRVAAGQGDNGRKSDLERDDARAPAVQRAAYARSEGKRGTAEQSDAGPAEPKDSPQGDTGKREGRDDSSG